MYSYSKETPLNFKQAVEKAKAELKKEGFGILTEIAVKDSIRRYYGKI